MEIKSEHEKYSHFLEKGNTHKLKESDTNLTVVAQNDLQIIKVDKGIIENENVKKCDYMSFSEQCTNFIELKGVKAERAYAQIYNTVDYLKNDDYYFLLNNKKVISYIVSPFRQQIPGGNSTERILARKLAGLNRHDKSQNIIEEYIKYVIVKPNLTHLCTKSNRIECSGKAPLPIE